jgi:hypothetical protein
MMKKHFSEAELQVVEKCLEEKVQELSSIWNAPLVLVNSDLTFNSWFLPV